MTDASHALRSHAHHRQTFEWLVAQYHQLRQPYRAVVLGLGAPQGAGKSTFVSQAVQWFADIGLRAVAVSIDDFYWPRRDQEALARLHPHNPYLQPRGYPGTHDLALGTQTLRTLAHLPAQSDCLVPSYAKSALAGLGDRTPTSQWPRVHGPLDVVLLEGWLLGFEPLQAVEHLDASLTDINNLLSDYNQWHAQLDALLLWRMADPHSVIAWRMQAEAARVMAGHAGLSAGEIRAYVELFLPAYALWGTRPSSICGAQQRTVVLGPDRLPLS